MVQGLRGNWINRVYEGHGHRLMSDSVNRVWNSDLCGHDGGEESTETTCRVIHKMDKS
jgi:hypothetical protein